MNPPTQFLSADQWERELQARDAAPVQSLPRQSGATSRLPALDVTGDPIEPKELVEPRTGLAMGISALVALLVAIFLIATITGAVVALAYLVAEYFAARRAQTILKGSALRVSMHQFPELHACVTSYARRLSMIHVPEVYVLDAAEVNGFALRLGRKNGIFLTDEAVAGCLEGRSSGAVAFVIGHEMAHIALGHQRWWRRMLCRLRWLSRLDECSADNVACELVGSSEAAQDGVLLLAAGPRLLSFVNREAARIQAAEVVRERASRRAERTLTHPLTMHRLHRVAKRFAPVKLSRAA